MLADWIGHDQEELLLISHSRVGCPIVWRVDFLNEKRCQNGTLF